MGTALIVREEAKIGIRKKEPPKTAALIPYAEGC
jgi:hypothetical protein